MKTTIRLAMLPILIFCFTGFAFAKAKWTYMIYMASDNDLEAFQLEDVNELLKAGSTKDVNIVLFCDRHSDGSIDDGFSNEGAGGQKDWKTGKVFLVQKGILKQVADFGETDTTDKATLSRFIRFAASTFPAEKYGLMMNDHGQGWNGGFFDATSKKEDDQLTVTKIQDAIRENIVLTGKYELIGFDACLMSSFETAHALAMYGKILIASEEVVPGHGWYYTTPFQALAKKPTMTGKDLAMEASKAFMDFYANHKDESIRSDAPTTTMSVIDLTKVPALAGAVTRLSVEMTSMVKKGRQDWLKIASAREATMSYAGGDLDTFDLGDYLKNLSAQVPSLKSNCDIALNLLKASVINIKNGSEMKASTGLNVFFPESREILEETMPERYSNMAGAASVKWSLFLDSYVQEAAKDTEAPQISKAEIGDSVLQAGNKTKVSAQVIGDDISKLYFILTIRQEGKSLMVGKLPMPGKRDSMSVARDWDGGWFLLNDGEHEYVCPLLHWVVSDKGFLFTVPVQHSVGGRGSWKNINLYFYVSNSGPEQDAKLVGAFMMSEFGLRGVRVRPGDQVRPVYPQIDDEGNLQYVYFTDALPLKVKDAKNLEVTYGKLRSGKYWIGFLAEDFSGNSDADFTEVTINRPN